MKAHLRTENLPSLLTRAEPIMVPIGRCREQLWPACPAQDSATESCCACYSPRRLRARLRCCAVLSQLGVDPSCFLGGHDVRFMWLFPGTSGHGLWPQPHLKAPHVPAASPEVWACVLWEGRDQSPSVFTGGTPPQEGRPGAGRANTR